MKYEIWQLPLSNKAKFMHYDWLEKKPQIPEYVMVYAGFYGQQKDTEEILEDIFYLLNENHPKDYHAASLSVSDLICLIDDYHSREWWYVDGLGFKKMEYKYNDF